MLAVLPKTLVRLVPRFPSIAAAATAMGAVVSPYSTGVNTRLVSEQVDEKRGHRVFPQFDPFLD
jgi:hypothetical protein